MDTYNTHKQNLLKINQDISSLLAETGAIPGISGETFDRWNAICTEIRHRISEDMLRIAVVGAIKSGKSTFVNSLFKGDYLKRGAGVVTSIVTRIRPGESLKAILWFKSWDQINQDIEGALNLFPSNEWRAAKEEPFDIRREKDRAELSAALDSLNRDLLIAHDSRSMDSVLLSAYLQGYDRVADILSDEPAIRIYEGEDFEKQKDFTGNDTLAIYLNDVQLEIAVGDIDTSLEIADCQGSDSPNPFHLAMIQDYLLLTHLIVYVVSSRTGLRQADIRFLSIIKKMGILNNTIFLINFDFSEHDHFEDLQAVAGKIQEEISLIRPAPDVYLLSALFNLFKSKEKDLPVKDRLRLAQWKGELALAEASDRDMERFESDVRRKLTRERYALLLRNHLERLGVILSGIDHWRAFNKDIALKSSSEVAALIDGIRGHEKKMERVRAMIRSTLNGAVQEVKGRLQNDIDRFFDPQAGVINNVLKFIKGYQADFNAYEPMIPASGFFSVMYLAFQEIKRAVDGYMAETVNPEVVSFLKGQEQKIRDHFNAIAGPYDTMVRDALAEYNQTMEGLGLPPARENFEKVSLPDMISLIAEVGLKIPAASGFMRYSVGIKSKAVMRLGIYRFIRFIKKIFKKPVKAESEGDILALKAAVSRLKQETETSVLFNFKDYRENIKFQYVLKLADAASEYLYEALLERFETYTADLTQITRQISGCQADKIQVVASLDAAEKRCREIYSEIESLRQTIEASVRS
jgi:GTPase SAR1 family protein